MKYLMEIENFKNLFEGKTGQIKDDFENLYANDHIVAYRKASILDKDNNIVKVIGNQKYVLDIGQIKYVYKMLNDKVNYNVIFNSSITYETFITSEKILFASSRKKDVIDYFKMLKTAKLYNL